MNITKHAEGVYEIEGFLDEEYRTALLSKAQNDTGWKTAQPGNTVKDMGDDLYFKIEPVYKNIEALFSNTESIIGLAAIS